MLKLIYILLGRLMPSLLRDDADWRCDPLSHPAICKMDPDELADLPFASMRSRNRR